MAEWSHAQLDLLEDAIEDLEQEGSLDRWLQDEPDPALRDRLEDYRALLEASREALPIEEVPAGVLDDVIAQAHQAAPAPREATVGLWVRLRRSFLVPVIALGGTAMLVLWVSKPEEIELGEPGRAVATADADEAKAGQATPPADGEAQSEVDATAEEEPAALPPARAAAAPVTAEPTEPEGAAENMDAEQSKRDQKPSAEPDLPADDSSRGGMGKLGEAPGVEAKQQAQTKSGGSIGGSAGRWDIISRGDRARLAGDCVAARDEYQVALEDDEAAVRARAYAGIGLCDAQEGNGPSADANYERARELDGSIDGFLESQRESKASKPRPKSKRKKSSSKKAIDLDQSADPFG